MRIEGERCCKAFPLKFAKRKLRIAKIFSAVTPRQLDHTEKKDLPSKNVCNFNHSAQVARKNGRFNLIRGQNISRTFSALRFRRSQRTSPRKFPSLAQFHRFAAKPLNGFNFHILLFTSQFRDFICVSLVIKSSFALNSQASGNKTPLIYFLMKNLGKCVKENCDR